MTVMPGMEGVSALTTPAIVPCRCPKADNARAKMKANSIISLAKIDRFVA
jgi:hypothetical protein